MGKLAKYLEIADAGPSKRKELVERYIPKELTAYDLDGKVERARELILTEGIEGSTLVQAEVYRSVMEGAEPRKCMRGIIPEEKMKSNSETIVLGEAGSYAQEVAEGAEIPIKTQEYGTRTLTVKKYGVRPVITKEMVEDSMFNTVELELRKAGAKHANKLNQLVLTDLLDNAGNEHDTDGSNQGIKAVASAIGLNQADGFDATHLIACPALMTMLTKEFVPGNYVGSDQVMAGGRPNILGLGVGLCSVADDSSTYTWGYASDGNIGGIVIDAPSAAMLGMRRDLTVEKYEDPIHDLVGMSTTMRYAYTYLQANAICRIEY